MSVLFEGKHLVLVLLSNDSILFFFTHSSLLNQQSKSETVPKYLIKARKKAQNFIILNHNRNNQNVLFFWFEKYLLLRICFMLFNIRVRIYKILKVILILLHLEKQSLNTPVPQTLKKKIIYFY